MEPSTENQKRFHIEKLEDRIAPAVLNYVQVGMTGNDATGFDVSANAQTAPQSQTQNIPGLPPLQVPGKIDAGPLHAQYGSGTPITVFPGTGPTPLTVGADSATVGTGATPIHVPPKVG